MQEKNNGMKTIVIMLAGFVIITIIGFMLTKVVEPRLQIQRGKIIGYELLENNSTENNMAKVSKIKPHFKIYTVQDDTTGEVSQIRYDNIMFPHNMLLNIMPNKQIVYSTYINAGIYNIMIGWKAVGILGILVCLLFIVKNPYKEE